MFRQGRAMGLEGIISKRRDCPYRSGRNEDWLKVKSAHRQEFVIAGYAPHTNSSRAVGSLILGEYRNGKLTHIGRAGTGYTARTARQLWEKLHPLEIDKAPFYGGRPSGYVARKLAKWVRPELVAEVEFRARTTDGLLRHASFKGLRKDKAAEEVVAEAPRAAPAEQEGRYFFSTTRCFFGVRKPIEPEAEREQTESLRLRVKAAISGEEAVKWAAVSTLEERVGMRSKPARRDGGQKTPGRSAALEEDGRLARQRRCGLSREVDWRFRSLCIVRNKLAPGLDRRVRRPKRR